MNRILVSACLLGQPVRYDGAANTIEPARLETLIAAGRIVAFCPEVSGGLPVPREPAEIVGGDGHAVLDGRARVLTRAGVDVSDFFIAGAKGALALCRKRNIRLALLTETSPSCGSAQIYDGSFARSRVSGQGVTAALLERHGVRVFGQQDLGQARHADAGRQPAQPQFVVLGERPVPVAPVLIHETSAKHH